MNAVVIGTAWKYFLAFNLLEWLNNGAAQTMVKGAMKNKRSPADKNILPGQTFTLNCPHVSKNPPYSFLTVTWMLDGAIWLKIQNGNPVINNKLNSKNSRQIGQNHVVNVVLNDHRYEYYYDEVVGDFNMNIRHATKDDAGQWQCDVEIFRQHSDVQKYTTYSKLTVGEMVDSIVTAAPPMIGAGAPSNDGFGSNQYGEGGDRRRVVFERENKGTNAGETSKRSRSDGHSAKGSGVLELSKTLIAVLLLSLYRHCCT